MFVDTHCHIDDNKFEDKKEIVSDLINNNVLIAINMGCDLESSFNGKILSKQFDNIFYAVGIHPSEVNRYCLQDLTLLKEYFDDKKCLAVGEIGLDYHFEPFDKRLQMDFFDAQIKIASNIKLPFSVHSRDATLDTINLISNNKSIIDYGFVMHCFSGSKETLKTYLDLGGYISFGGTLTFKNASNLVEVIKYVPIDRLLCETDSPYLSPEPFRGCVNKPSNVRFVYQKISSILNINFEDLQDKILQNTKRLFYRLNG